jgi:hypothetical protein
MVSLIVCIDLEGMKVIPSGRFDPSSIAFMRPEDNAKNIMR